MSSSGPPPDGDSSEGQGPAHGQTPGQSTPPGGYPPPAPPPGGYPPPPGGYPPPGGGPPPGGYSGYGYGYGGPQPFSTGDAFNYGWRKFEQNFGTIFLAALAWLGIVLAVVAVWVGALSAAFAGLDEESAETASLVGGLLVFLAIMLVFLFMQAGFVRGGLAITYGRELRVATTFSFDNIGSVVGAAILITLMVAVGLVLCVIPGLIVAFYMQFVMFFIIDKNMGPIEAIKASASLVNGRIGTMAVLTIGTYIALSLGALVCYVGLLLAVPVVIIARTYAYRVLQDEAVAP